MSTPFVEPVCGWFVSLTETDVGLLAALFGSAEQCSDVQTLWYSWIPFLSLLSRCLWVGGWKQIIKKLQKAYKFKTSFHNRFYKTYLHLHQRKNTVAARQMIIMLVTELTVAKCWWKKERERKKFQKIELWAQSSEIINIICFRIWTAINRTHMCNY